MCLQMLYKEALVFEMVRNSVKKQFVAYTAGIPV